MLRYKTLLRGGRLVEAGMFFPSSKLCCECGWKNDALQLKDRDWSCQVCGTVHDRDINAAMNLKNYAVNHTVKAHGQESSGLLNASRQTVSETDLVEV